MRPSAPPRPVDDGAPRPVPGPVAGPVARPVPDAAAGSFPDPVAARLSRVLARFVARRRLHHADVALVDGAGARWSAAVGPDDDGPRQPGAPFFVASVTKRFVVTLVLQAHERGELDLAAPVVRYLPPETTRGLHVLGGVDRTPAITVRHLASHTSGLPDQFEKRPSGPSLFALLAAGRDAAWTFEDVLRTTREQGAHFPPQDLDARRQKARYSDTGYQLLIRVLESATGRSFADLLADRVTGPLGLASTWLPGHPPARLAGAAPSPLHVRRRHVELPGMIGSSNDLVSTTDDLLAFQRALLAGELFARPGTTALLTERANRLRNIPVVRYGLGTMTFRVGRLTGAGRRPVTLVGHSGATGTWLFHCPELDLHLAGTVDQAGGQALPFHLMAHLLHAWRTTSLR
ncbi:serine hydrolase domain-containing protein [Puerhibacterium sp. TATVAM-FAB25]|uniref:serine hydrolase domain-containing protein n=1 Tax=Puerhibacterium sp. TATVAM-FAB25 TaxID=3093699 RepID=UPI00397A3A84